MKTFDFSRIWRTIVSPTTLPAAVAAAVIAILGIYADHQNRVVFSQAQHADVLARLNLVKTKLEGNINGNIQLVRGLAAVVEVEPEMDRKRFEGLARNLLDNVNQLRSIALAPDLIVSMVYPTAGNEGALGLDYRTNERQRSVALKARDTRSLVLSNPIDLIQGGKGIVGRFPVFVDDNRFWGLISAVIDVERLYRDSGLYNETGVEIALVGQDRPHEEPMQFFGRADILNEQPVMMTVVLPSGSWRIAGIPSKGWASTPDNAWLLRGLIAVAGLLVVVPIAVAGRFYAGRQKHYAALQDSETRFRRLSQRFEFALDASHIGVWELDLATNRLIWDDRLYQIYGIEKKDEQHTYQDWANALHPEDLERAEADFRQQVAENRAHSSLYRAIHPNGEVRYIRTHAVIVQDPQGPSRMIGAEWDVTDDIMLNKALENAKVLAEMRSAELETAKARIEHVAMHDSLTGLPNRRYLDEHLQRLATVSAQGGRDVGLLHIDLDRFKQINDTLGHAAGDAMLVHAAQVLRQCVRQNDFVARIGGDEFVVVCAVDPGSDRLGDIANRIIGQMRVPVVYRGQQCRFGVSIGIASDGGDEIDARQLLVNADIALYRAKSRGRNRCEVFTDTLQADILRNKKVADDILRGLERNEFIAYYQPQFDAHTLEIAGVEALVRWAHPSEGLLTPAAFLATADDLNVVSTLDRLILEQTLVDFKRWRAAGLAVPRVSVNVSARRLRDEELVTSLRRLEIPRGTLSFELLESIFLDDTDEIVRWNVDRIKELGIDIEIDDFGTGYASIVSLLKLQPRRLKIDRQLIQPIVKSVRQRHLVESIIEIGKTLGIDVVAEGVESMAHARILKRIGCDKLQGYAFGPVMSAGELEAYIRDRAWRAAS